MKNQSYLQRIALAISLLALFSFAAKADDTTIDRTGHWEIGMPGKYWMGDDFIESALGTGFMVGYNFNDHWNINVEGYCGIHLETEVDGVDGKGSIYTAIVNLEYYIKPGRFSPYVTASTGVFNYDTKEDFNGSSAFSENGTGVSYGGGAGVRWEISPHWFVKGSYHVFGTTAEHAEFFHGPEITIGFLF